MRPYSILLMIATCAVSLLAQDKKPALITREQYAESNLLFSWQKDIGTGFETTLSCIRIHPDGNFHRESWKDNSKPKFAETGKLSDSELTELKAMLDDPEFRTLRQDPTRPPKATVTPKVGYQIFSVSVFRTSEKQSQDLLFFSDGEYTEEPTKVQQLQKHLIELETRKDSSLQRVAADGCHAYPVPEKK